jgi:ParB-like chromosome segregation protein Spo0J
MTNASNTPINVPLHQLRANVDYQPRMRLEQDQPYDERHVRQLMVSDFEAWPSLLVKPNDVGGYDIVSGFHRFEAAKRLGLKELRCVVDPNADYPEAFAANMEHGLPLTTEDRKDYARWLREHQPELSEVQISKRTGLSRNTVRKALGKHPVQREQRSRSPQEPADPMDELVQVLVSALHHSEQSNVVQRIFNRKTKPEQRAAYVLQYINGQKPTNQRGIAYLFATFGAALHDGSKQFLSR